MRKMEVNGISGAAAEELYRRAFDERVRTIRSPAWNNLWIGVGAVTTSVVSFCFIWYFLGAITNQFILICSAGLALGLWKVLSGISGILGAVAKEGPVSE